MEMDIRRIESALRQNAGDDGADRGALLAVKGVPSCVEIANHLDHERPGVGLPVPAFLTGRWEIPVSAGPRDAGGIDGEMLADVVPPEADVVLPHRLYRCEASELGPVGPPRVVQVNVGDSPTEVRMNRGKKRKELLGGQAADLWAHRGQPPEH